MSKVKISDLAKELGTTWKELAEEIKNLTGKTIKSPSTKIDEEIVTLIKDMYGVEEEPQEVEEKHEEKGIKIFDLSKQLNVSFEEIAQALRLIDFKGEISNFTVLDEDTISKVKEALKEIEKKKEEERRLREEKEKKRKKLKERKLVSEKAKPERSQEKTLEKEKTPVEKFEKLPEKPQPGKKKIEKKPEKPEKAKEQPKEPLKEKIKKEKIVAKEEKKKEKSQEKKFEKKPEKVEIKPEKTTQELKKEREEMEALRKLMGQVKSSKKKSKHKKKEKKKEEVETKQEEEVKIVEIPELITVRELAELLDLPVNTIMADLLKKGILATVNQTIDPETALQIAEEHGFLAELKTEEEVVEKSLKTELSEESEDEGNLVERPPVVTVMGHVDHGKTTLLDTIRKTDVAAREKGGITQHIGAYKIKLENGKEITFLDTPGHEAFTTLRARGSKVADIAVLVVAADDGVQPQTVEAINHAKSAELPIIVAINKIDKPGADPERVKRELSQYELIPEEWGGDTIMVPVSAKTGENVDELLENILLLAEILELKANPEKPAVGTIIESKLDPKRGPVATVLVQNGTLKQGDYFVAGMTWGKVRAMFDERGKQVKNAPPGTPVEVLGFQDVPQAGDRFVVMPSEREAKQLAEQRKEKYEEELLAKRAKLKLESLHGEKEVNIILKADVQGSLEAIVKTLEELSNKFEEVSINIIHSGIGRITESDVVLAAASNAIIIGFNVRPDAAARKLAEEEGVEIRTYGIIYEIVEDLEKALKGLLEPKVKEEILGMCDVKAIFRVKGVGTVAGCYVTDGVIRRNAKARLIRDGIVIYDGEIISLKRFKDDVKEVAKGYECGLMLKDFNDIKPGDLIEAYELVEEKEE